MRDKIKILYVAPLESIHADRWIKYFIDIGHEVHIICVTASIRKKIEGSIIYNIKWSRSINPFNEYMRFFYVKKEFIKIIESVNPDICHVHGISIYGYILKLVTNRPVISTAWGSEVLIDTKKSFKYKIIQFISIITFCYIS